MRGFDSSLPVEKVTFFYHDFDLLPFLAQNCMKLFVSLLDLTVFNAFFYFFFQIKATLEEHFGSCGEIVRISVPKFRESGDVRGYISC